MGFSTIKARGVLRVGTCGNYPPFSYSVAAGERVGLDVKLALRFGQQLGVRTVFVPFKWPQLINDLKQHRFDLAMSGINITESRQAVATFSDAYVTSGAMPLIAPHLDARTVEEINRSGLRIVVNQGGYLESVARRVFGNAAIFTITENLQLGEYVARDNADALLTDSLEAPYILQGNPTLRPLPRITTDKHAALFPKRDSELRDAFNQLLQHLTRTGRFDRLKAIYGITD
ncbi:MAG: transporter substrate-binding domain-containing protein [Deltaproteobacteria bacterium]|nr:transporter substrate-binding domain-containing protein [Deltaproteobacteria bacterium]